MTNGRRSYSGLVSAYALQLPLCASLRVRYLVFTASLVVILALSLPSVLKGLSCSATPGVVLNLLLLADVLGNINKPGETMD